MLHYPVEDIIIAEEVPLVFDKEFLVGIQKYLNQSNMLVLLSNKDLYCPLKEEYFGVEYNIENLESKSESKVKVELPKVEEKNKYKLPEKNTYISTDYTIYKSKLKSSEIPELVINKNKSGIQERKPKNIQQIRPNIFKTDIVLQYVILCPNVYEIPNI